MLQSSTGRRPTRSESRPQIGMKRNCMIEKTAPGMVAMKSPAPRRRAMPGRNGITSPKPSRSRKIVRNSVPSEALPKALASTRWARRRSAVFRPRRGRRGSSATRARGHQAPVARRSARLAKTIAPVDDAHGGGVRRERLAKEGLHGGRILAHSLDERGDVRRLAAAKGEAVEPELEVDPRLVRRHEVGRAPRIARLVPQIVRRPAAVVRACLLESGRRIARRASVCSSGSIRSRVIDAKRW